MQIRMLILQIPQNSHLLHPSGNIKEVGFGTILVEVATELMAKAKQYKCRLKVASAFRSELQGSWQ